MKSLLLYGGSFDPPHNGHLQTAVNVQKFFNFDEVIFIPCRTQKLKFPLIASPQERLQMLKILLKNYPEFSISTYEIDKELPSYTSETLKHFRAKYGWLTSITLLVGVDTYISMPKWHEWEIIPTLANLLVINRPQYNMIFSEEPDDPGARHTFIDKSTKPLEILESSCGSLVYFNAGEYSVSSTSLREKIKNKQYINDLITEEIADFIFLNNLYT